MIKPISESFNDQRLKYSRVQVQISLTINSLLLTAVHISVDNWLKNKLFIHTKVDTYKPEAPHYVLETRMSL